MPALASACILFLTFSMTSFALDASERLFIWNEANAVMQNSRTASEYLNAARVYQRLIDDGVRNGPLFYNIGTALLLAERYDLAADAFERTEGYLGRQADNDRNLKIAYARKMKSGTLILPWYRLAAFWHFYLSCPQRTLVAAGAFLVFWIVLALKYALRLTTGLTARRMGLERLTGALALTCLVVFIVFATSVAASWQLENSAKRYNLVLPPAPSATNIVAAVQ